MEREPAVGLFRSQFIRALPEVLSFSSPRMYEKTGNMKNLRYSKGQTPSSLRRLMSVKLGKNPMGFGGQGWARREMQLLCSEGQGMRIGDEGVVLGWWSAPSCLLPSLLGCGCCFFHPTFQPILPGVENWFATWYNAELNNNHNSHINWSFPWNLHG